MPSWANQQMCNICGNYFANSKCLKKHVQSVHDKFKPFICNICGHKTARKAMLDVCMDIYFLNKILLFNRCSCIYANIQERNPTNVQYVNIEQVIITLSEDI